MTGQSPSLTRNILNLIKLPISITSSLAALFGYTAYSQRISTESIPVVAAVFCLSSGAAVLNNLQDRKIDRLMERTRNRPIASGKIGEMQAAFISLILILTGIAFLSITPSFFPSLAAGMAALLLYNALYTPLKTRTGLALLPGIISGSLPPMIGWLAAGGDALSFRIAAVMVFFIIWQIPHFWLILLMRGDEYKNAGINSIRDFFSEEQIKRLLFVWVAAYALISIFPVLVFSIKTSAAVLLIYTNTFALVIIFAVSLFRQADRKKYAALYHYLNLSTIGVILIALINAML